MVISYLALRKAVGVLGMVLPVALLLGVFLFSKCSAIQDSISDYYFTIMGDLFVGILCAVALFLFSYKGYDRRDYIASKLASVFALGVAFFPTTGPSVESGCNFLQRNAGSVSSDIHNISAACFFGVLAYMALFLFTKGDPHPTANKRRRNVVFRVCGYTMAAAILLLFIYFKVPALQESLGVYKPVFILETTALWAFGFSWLTKGEMILKDE